MHECFDVGLHCGLMMSDPRVLILRLVLDALCEALERKMCTQWGIEMKDDSLNECGSQSFKCVG